MPMAKIDFSDYVENLATYLFQSYAVSTDYIDLEVHVDDALLTVDTAIPCGLIVNELVSNSLKYAFPFLTGSGGKDEIEEISGEEIKEIYVREGPDGRILSIDDDGSPGGQYEEKAAAARRNEIVIESRKVEGDRLTLVVRDNGIEIPGEVDLETSKTLGLRLVGMLTRQIDGKLELDREGGTEFRITFPRHTS